MSRPRHDAPSCDIQTKKLSALVLAPDSERRRCIGGAHAYSATEEAAVLRRQQMVQASQERHRIAAHAQKVQAAASEQDNVFEKLLAEYRRLGGNSEARRELLARSGSTIAPSPLDTLILTRGDSAGAMSPSSSVRSMSTWRRAVRRLSSRFKGSIATSSSSTAVPPRRLSMREVHAERLRSSVLSASERHQAVNVFVRAPPSSALSPKGNIRKLFTLFTEMGLARIPSSVVMDGIAERCEVSPEEDLSLLQFLLALDDWKRIAGAESVSADEELATALQRLTGHAGTPADPFSTDELALLSDAFALQGTEWIFESAAAPEELTQGSVLALVGSDSLSLAERILTGDTHSVDDSSRVTQETRRFASQSPTRVGDECLLTQQELVTQLSDAAVVPLVEEMLLLGASDPLMDVQVLSNLRSETMQHGLLAAAIASDVGLEGREAMPPAQAAMSKIHSLGSNWFRALEVPMVALMDSPSLRAGFALSAAASDGDFDEAFARYVVTLAAEHLAQPSLPYEAHGMRRRVDFDTFEAIVVRHRLNMLHLRHTVDVAPPASLRHIRAEAGDVHRHAIADTLNETALSASQSRSSSGSPPDFSPPPLGGAKLSLAIPSPSHRASRAGERSTASIDRCDSPLAIAAPNDALPDDSIALSASLGFGVSAAYDSVDEALSPSARGRPHRLRPQRKTECGRLLERLCNIRAPDPITAQEAQAQRSALAHSPRRSTLALLTPPRSAAPPKTARTPRLQDSPAMARRREHDAHSEWGHRPTFGCRSVSRTITNESIFEDRLPVIAYTARPSSSSPRMRLNAGPSKPTPPKLPAPSREELSPNPLPTQPAEAKKGRSRSRQRPVSQSRSPRKLAVEDDDDYLVMGTTAAADASGQGSPTADAPSPWRYPTLRRQERHDEGFHEALMASYLQQIRPY